MRARFVVGDASPSTAPATLLTFLEWVVDETPARPEIVLLRGGPLADRFTALGPTHVVAPAEHWSPTEVVELGLTRLGHPDPAARLTSLRLRARLRSLGEAEVTWLHGAPAAPALRGLGGDGPTLVAFPQAALDLVALPDEDRAALVRSGSVFLASTDGVAATVATEFGLDRSRVAVAPPFVAPPATLVPGAEVAARRRAWGVPQGALVVGLAGRVGWRDGADLLARLAVALRRVVPATPPVHLVWMGGPKTGPEWAALAYDLVRADLGTWVHVVEDLPDHTAILAFDLFVSLSRDDGISASVLEAAAAGRPVLGFDSSAVGELGTAVPFLDIEGLALAVAALGRDSTRRRAATRAADLAHTRFGVRVGAPIWWEHLQAAAHR